ncbi:MAG: hypothetical protein AAGG51_02210 [Cyanobacteria bacterium P01_G01_bin.54]
MFEFTTLINLSKAVLDWINAISSKRKSVSEAEQAGLLALSVAVNETRIYLGSLYRLSEIPTGSKGEILGAGQRDFATETSLSRLWADASHRTRFYQREISEICFMKADFWASPELWGSQYGHRQILALERMNKAFRSYIVHRL